MEPRADDRCICGRDSDEDSMSDQQQVASHHYSMLHKVLCIPRINTMVPELPILKRNGNKSIRNTKEKQTSPTFSS